MFQIGEFSFLLAQEGFGSGILDANHYSLILSAAILSMFITPLLASLTAPLYALLQNVSGKDTLETINLPRGELSGHVVIVGGGRVGQHVARVLKQLDVLFVIRITSYNVCYTKLLRSLLASEEPQSVVESLCNKAMEVLDCQVFFNFLVDEDEEKLHLNACGGIPDEQKRLIEWIDYGVAVCGCAARDACRIVIEDLPNIGDPRAEMLMDSGVQAFACHPLMVQGRVLGTLSFGTTTRPRFSNEDLSLMRVVADHVAIAMARQRTQIELLKAKEGAELATRAKGQFLANIV